MKKQQIIRWVAKPLVFAAALVPLGLAAYDGVNGRLGAEPIREIQLRTGWWALTFLMVTLSVTPLRRLTGWNDLIKFRRMLGLFAFFYAVLHLSNYIGVDQFFAWGEIGHDILKRPWITIGMTALVLMTPLAATSTQAMQRRLGKRWAALHRLVYVAAACGVLHFLWLVKKDTREPVTFGLILIVLLVIRLRWERHAKRGVTAAVPARSLPLKTVPEAPSPVGYSPKHSP